MKMKFVIIGFSSFNATMLSMKIKHSKTTGVGVASLASNAISHSKPKLTVLTTATLPLFDWTKDRAAELNGEFCVGFENLMKNGIDLVVLGSTVPPEVEYKGGQSSWHAKIAEVNKYLTSTKADTASEKDILLFADFRDVYFTVNFTEENAIRIISDLLGDDPEDKKVLFSADYFCYPHEYCEHMAPLLQSIKGPYYLNSGVFAGTVASLRNLVSGWVSCLNSGQQEQGCVHWLVQYELQRAENKKKIEGYYENGRVPQIVLDYDTKLVLSNTRIRPFSFHDVSAHMWVECSGWGLSMAGSNCYTWTDTESKCIVNPFSGNIPLIEHFNGGLSRPHYGMLLFKKSEYRPRDFDYLGAYLTVLNKKVVFKAICDDNKIVARYDFSSGNSEDKNMVCWN